MKSTENVQNTESKKFSSEDAFRIYDYFRGAIFVLFFIGTIVASFFN